MRLVLYGVSSPYAADAVETAARLGWEFAACVRNVATGEEPPELPSVLDAGALTPELLALPFLVPLMKPQTRRAASEDARARGFSESVAMVDPTATIAASARIGAGSYVNARAILAAGVLAGAACAINRGASIGHHSVLEDYASIGPGAVTGGACRICEGAFLGVGAVIAPEVCVGAGRRGRRGRGRDLRRGGGQHGRRQPRGRDPIRTGSPGALGSARGRRPRSSLARAPAAGRLPVRRRPLRDHRALRLGGLLPLHAMPAAHRHRLLRQRPRAAGRLSPPAGR